MLPPRRYVSKSVSCLQSAAGEAGPGRGSSRHSPALAAPGGPAASATGGSAVSVGEAASTPGEGAAEGIFAARSECQSGWLKALGWFIATEDERREKPVVGDA